MKLSTTVLQTIHEGHFNPVPPFEFQHSLSYLCLHAPTADNCYVGEYRFIKPFFHNGNPIVINCWSRGKVESPLLHYRIMAEQAADAATVQEIEARLRFFLSADESLQPLYDIGWDDDPFADLLDRYYGYHHVKFATPFEAACWVVLYQRQSLQQAVEMKRKLIEGLSHPLKYEDTLYLPFPEPAGFLSIPAPQLAQLINHPQKAHTLQSIASAFADCNNKWMKTAPYAEVRDWLLSINGIGPWSAPFIMQHGAGRMSHFSVTSERRFLQAAQAVYGPTTTVETLKETGRRYKDWQGYWALYIQRAALEHSTEVKQ